MQASSDTGFYFFSSLLQADAAILAIIGLFITFRLQSLQLIINNLRERITAVLYQPRNDEERIQRIRSLTTFDESTIQEKIDFANKHKGVGLFNYLNDEIPYHKEVEKVRTKFRLPGYSLAILISLNIAGLIFTNKIHHSAPDYEVLILGIIGFLHAFIYFMIVYQIQDILKK